MTRLSLVAAALIAAATFSTDAFAARSVSHRHTEAAAKSTTDCVRAPDVGAYATAPYSEPPCLPGTAG
ncbi:hypothetical protein [Bradyrhizobium sp. USDA 3364]